MKLLSSDFIRAMKTYKSIKTILKSDLNQMTLSDGVIRIDLVKENEHSQLLIDADLETTEDITINEESLNTFVKLNVKEVVEVEKENVVIDGKKVPYLFAEKPIVEISTCEYTQVFSCKASEFKAALKGVSVAVAKDQVRPVLTNVLLDGDTMVAVDGFRIFTRSLKVDSQTYLLIKPHTVKILLKLLPTKGEEILSILVGADNQYCVTWEDYTLIDTASEGEYLNYKTVFLDECEYVLDVDRKDLIDSLEFIVNSSNEKKPVVKCVLKEDVLQIGQDVLEASYSKFSGAPGEKFAELQIAFNPLYLMDSFKAISDDYVSLSFISSLTPVIVTHSKGKDLILPVRLNS